MHTHQVDGVAMRSATVDARPQGVRRFAPRGPARARFEAFAQFMEAEQNIADNGRLLSYRQIAQALGEKTKNVWAWMAVEYPEVAGTMSLRMRGVAGAADPVRAHTRIRAAVARGLRVAVAEGRGVPPVRKPVTTPEQRAEMRRLCAEGMTRTSVGKRFGIDKRTVCSIVNGRGCYANEVQP